MSISETTKGNGWAATSIDALGGGLGFKKIRPELDVTEFGINCITLPPRFQTGIHWHERQQEVYFVHDGTLVFHFGSGAEPDETVEVSAGSFINVDAATPREVARQSEGDSHGRIDVRSGQVACRVDHPHDHEAENQRDPD